MTGRSSPKCGKGPSRGSAISFSQRCKKTFFYRFRLLPFPRRPCITSLTPQRQLEAKKSLRADSQDELLKAEREVKLNLAEKGNQLDIYVDGPFRCRNGSVDWSDLDYIVTYDFTMQVPEQASLILKTVNDGDILVKNVKGDFTVRNVNGHIELQDIVGPASCKTVNGRIRAVFREDPAAACSFQTVNGDLDVSFSSKLAADFQLKTFNGDIYSDFPSSYLPGKAETEHSQKGRFIYRSHRFQGVRIGAGGPEIRMETLNGDIAIANKNKEK
ncbi:MAG: DUF4097 family beta strand repeat-containing protein [Candidatus Aminicenantes bacterium]|nr:DUF4097 family beta strand repeat-containing protein [Candidatus Aminicenantes bacterium]